MKDDLLNLLKQIYADRIKQLVNNTDISENIGVVVNPTTQMIEVSLLFSSQFTLEELQTLLKNNLQ